MTLLLDTQAFLWLLDSPDKLSAPAIEAIRHCDEKILLVSAISYWEIAKKESLGKLKLSMASQSWLARAARQPGITTAVLSPEISWEACHLPGTFHRDPADQIIVATARVQGLQLITSDERIREYDHVTSIW